MIQEKKRKSTHLQGKESLFMYYCSRYIKKQILDENYFKPRILTKIILESEDGTIIFIEMHERTKERYSPHPLKKKKEPLETILREE